MKLNPNDVDTLNILGHILWKKGDLEGSKNCFEESVKKKANLRGLRYLAIILRAAPCDPKDKSAVIQRSADLAKQAVGMDLKDGESWYFLGNAYLAQHCHNWKGSQNLTQAIKCYSEAEKHMAVQNADLHYNRAKVYETLIEFELAIQEYTKSGQIDPTLPVAAQLARIRDCLTQVHWAIQYKGRLKPKQIEKSLREVKTGFRKESFLGKMELGPISKLVPGPNKEKFFAGKVAQLVSKEGDTP